MSGGTNDSAAVVTAAIRSPSPLARLGRVRRAAALVEQADDVGRVRRELASGRSRPDAATLALEQVDADLARRALRRQPRPMAA